ncbi:MAG: segregation/condensation protein A, partial [Clostridia bacterium]|nr:segregation/condensation protein A [Clostridia bacterium]
YRQFKEVSARMHELEEQARDLLTKLPEEYPLPPPNIEITGLTLEKLIKAYRRVLERAARAEAADRMASREIRRDALTVASCMARISRRVRRGRCSFSDLFDEAFTRHEVVTMFLALLELIKLNRVHVSQARAYEDIYLTA